MSPYPLSTPKNQHESIEIAIIKTFEPRDEVKVDIARMIFYMAVRYEGENGEPDLELTNKFPRKKDKRPFYGRIGTLIFWCQARWWLDSRKRILETQNFASLRLKTG